MNNVCHERVDYYYICMTLVHHVQMQINELFSGTPLSEGRVFSVENSNAAGSRFVHSTFTIGFVQHFTTACQHHLIKY